jgi:hypothetical protein
LFRRFAFGGGPPLGGLALSSFAAFGDLPRDRLHPIRGFALSRCHAPGRVTFDCLHALRSGSFSGFRAVGRGTFGRFEACGRVSLDGCETIGGFTFETCQTFRRLTIGSLARLSHRFGDGLGTLRLRGIAEVGHSALHVPSGFVAETVGERVDSAAQLLFETHDGTSI